MNDLSFGNEENQNEALEIREIPNKRRYWFVRTFGGALFEYYYSSKKVGILGNDVPLVLIKNAPHDNVTFSSLQNYIFTNIYPENTGEATKLANQLIDFYHHVKVDDIVMMPSVDSDFIAFGRVTSKMKERDKPFGTFMYKETQYDYPTKYHEIEWLTIKRKRDVLGDMRPLFSTYMGITNADKYGEFIESSISTFFTKEEYYYFSMFVDLNDDEELNAFELHRYLEAVIKLYKHYCVANDIEDNEELYLKIKIQSQGNNILKWLKTAGGIGIASMLAMSITGTDPEVKYSSEEGFVGNMKGNFFKNLTTAYDDVSKTNRENKKKDIELESMQIDLIDKKRKLGLLTPEEIEKYQIQLKDSADALNLKNIESKNIKISDVIGD